jgi:hypothetical protein
LIKIIINLKLPFSEWVAACTSTVTPTEEEEEAVMVTVTKPEVNTVTVTEIPTSLKAR